MDTILDTDKVSGEDVMPSMVSVDMQVTPLKKHGKELACAIAGTSVDGGVIELGTANSHTMTFQLMDGNVPGLKFVSDADNYPFSSTTDDCPRRGDQVNQFTSMTLSPDRRTLTVVADPGSDPIVHYALRFEDEDAKVFKWDPIIINN